MRDVKAAAAKKDGAPGGAALKTPGSAKKDKVSGATFDEQEKSLAPGGAADQSTMASGECIRTRYGDPAPFSWSLSYTCAGMMDGSHQSKGRTTVQESMKADDIIMEGATDRAQFIYGKHTWTTDGKVNGPESVTWAFDENLGRYQQAKTQMKNSEGVRGVKDQAPSNENKTSMKRCG